VRILLSLISLTEKVKAFSVKARKGQFAQTNVQHYQIRMLTIDTPRLHWSVSFLILEGNPEGLHPNCHKHTLGPVACCSDGNQIGHNNPSKSIHV